MLGSRVVVWIYNTEHKSALLKASVQLSKADMIY